MSGRMLITTVMIVSFYSIFLTNGISSMTIVLILIICFFVKTKKNFSIRNPEYKFDKALFLKHLCLISLTGLLYVSLKTNFTFDVDGLMFYGDHYYYAKIAISLQESGIETRNFSNAYSGVAVTSAYHYFELYFCALTSILGLPVLLCYEFVYPILYIYIILTLFINTRFDFNKLLVLILVTIVLLIRPTVPIHAEYIVNENFIFQNIKLLVPITFLTLIATSKDEFFSYLLLCILAIIYPTTLFAILAVLFFTLTKHIINKKKFSELGFPIITTLLILTYLSLERLIPNFRESSNIGVGFNNIDIWGRAIFDSFIFWIRPMIGRNLPYTLIFILIIYKAYKSKKHELNSTLIFIGLPGALIGASLFFKTIDNEQIFANYYTSLTVALCILFLHENQSKKRFLMPILSGVSVVYLIIFQFSIVHKNHYPGLNFLSIHTQNKLISIVTQDRNFYGSLKGFEQFNSKYFSNTGLNQIGKEVLNFGNKTSVNITPLDKLLALSKDSVLIRRIKKDQFYGVSNIYKNSYQILTEKFNGVFSSYQTDTLTFRNYNSYKMELIDSLDLPKGYSNVEEKVFYYKGISLTKDKPQN